MRIDLLTESVKKIVSDLLDNHIDRSIYSELDKAVKRILMKPRVCQCGCGQAVTRRFARGHNFRLMRGVNHPRWLGGRFIKSGKGDIMVYRPGHPRADQDHVREHLLIAEHALGRALPRGVEVHHVNGNRSDNRHSNLVICENHAYHSLLHRRTNALYATGNVNNRVCRYCRQWDVNLKQSGKLFYHAYCNVAYMRIAYYRKKKLAALA